MGGISTIARRLPDKHVQYDWSGSVEICLRPKEDQHVETILWQRFVQPDRMNGGKEED